MSLTARCIPYCGSTSNSKCTWSGISSIYSISNTILLLTSIANLYQFVNFVNKWNERLTFPLKNWSRQKVRKVLYLEERTGKRNKEKQIYRGADSLCLTASRTWNTSGRNMSKAGCNGTELLSMEEEIRRNATQRYEAIETTGRRERQVKKAGSGLKLG